MSRLDTKRSASRAAWLLDSRMTIVLFAGMGGGCDGLEEAGHPVDLAINHDALAIAVHEARHPHTRHLRCDVFEVDPVAATGGRAVGILHASPDCTHFSVAKGAKPVSRRRRSLAWVVLRWAGTVGPDVITLENVREITTWGPLVAKRDRATGRVVKIDGSIAAPGERVPVERQWLIPDPRRKGRTWRAWLRHLRALGYSVEHRNLCCADFGIPTIRTRLFGVARKDGGPIVWPSPTHAPRLKAPALGLRPWVGADTIIDWSLPVRSIFGRRKPLADATLRRIARGVLRYVVQAHEPFIVPITHGGDLRVHPIAEPLRTLTTAHRGELMLISPLVATSGYGERDGQQPRARRVDLPLGTQVGARKEALVAAFLAQHNTGVVGRDVRDPLSTVTTGGEHGQTQQGLVAATLGSLRGTDMSGQDIALPLPAQCSGGHEMLILPFLQAYYSSGGQDQDARDPLLAVTSKARHGLVTVQVHGRTMVITDICMRMLSPLEGARAHGFDPASLQHEITVTDGRGRTVRRPPTKTEIGHLVGNSVPPRMVRLLAEANVSPQLAAGAA